MKRYVVAVFVCIGLAFAVSQAQAQCVTLKAGTLVYQTGAMTGEPITTGVNPYGYNYQAHMFNGTYFNAYAASYGFLPYDGDAVAYVAANPTVVSNGLWQYRDVELTMKWNDAWLSNKDCNGDGLLDRPSDSGGTYIGSGAWATNHQKGFTLVDGKELVWTYFVKIVAPPSDATNTAGVWYAANGTEIGPSEWGDFAIIQQVSNDASVGDHGIYYLTPYSAGFGRFSPK